MTEILSEKESTDLRELFTETFADTNSFEFDKGIRQKTCFSFGEFYSACLWDFFKNPIKISTTECMESVRNKLSPFYVMFDLHSAENIPAIRDSKYDNSRIIKMTFEDFIKELDSFADDPYIFDETLEETIVFTHEYSDKGSRYCLKAKA